MSLEYGFIQNYRNHRSEGGKGFGFVSRIYGVPPSEATNIYFHITTVQSKYPDFAGKLENDDCTGVGFWFVIESTVKGLQVKEIWLAREEIPADLIHEFIDNLRVNWANLDQELPSWVKEATLSVGGLSLHKQLEDDRVLALRERDRLFNQKLQFDYGFIQDYKFEVSDTLKGFGYVSRTIESLPGENNRVLFHIGTIRRKDPNLARHLEEGHRYTWVNFWYTIEITPTGHQVREIWVNFQDVPPEFKERMINSIIEIWRNIQIDVSERIQIVTHLIGGSELEIKLKEERARLIQEFYETEEGKQQLELRKQEEEARSRAQLLAEKKAARQRAVERRRLEVEEKKEEARKQEQLLAEQEAARQREEEKKLQREMKEKARKRWLAQLLANQEGLGQKEAEKKRIELEKRQKEETRSQDQSPTEQDPSRWGVQPAIPKDDPDGYFDEDYINWLIREEEVNGIEPVKNSWAEKQANEKVWCREEPKLKVRNGTEASAIQQFCLNRGIQFLLHFTRIENLSSILQHGLLGRVTLHKRFPNELYLFNDDMRLDNLMDAVCLSISYPNYLMFYKYRNGNPGKWVVLKLRPEILWNFECVFCHKNAASNEVRYLPISSRQGLPALVRMFSNEAANRDDLWIPPSYTTDPQAEVLVLEGIQPSYIEEVHFEDFDEYLGWASDYEDPYHALYKFDQSFFNSRSDWEFWKRRNIRNF